MINDIKMPILWAMMTLGWVYLLLTQDFACVCPLAPVIMGLGYVAFEDLH